MSAQLPILATVGATYRSVREHAPALAILSRGTAVAAGVALAVSYGLIQLLFGGDAERAQRFAELPVGEQVAAHTSLSILVVSVGVFVIIVKWHRMLILDAPPDATRVAATRAGLLYLARGILLSALGMAIAILGGLLPVTLMRSWPLGDDVRWWTTLACVFGGVVAALLVVGRLSLILPAGAVGDYRVTMGRAWALSRGNSWRILAGSSLASGPVFVANIGLSAFIDALPSMSASVPSLIAALTLSLMLFVVTAIVQASFLSFAYKHFVATGSDLAD